MVLLFVALFCVKYDLSLCVDFSVLSGFGFAGLFAYLLNYQYSGSSFLCDVFLWTVFQHLEIFPVFFFLGIIDFLMGSLKSFFAGLRSLAGSV